MTYKDWTTLYNAYFDAQQKSLKVSESANKVSINSHTYRVFQARKRASYSRLKISNAFRELLSKADVAMESQKAGKAVFKHVRIIRATVPLPPFSPKHYRICVRPIA